MKSILVLLAFMVSTIASFTAIAETWQPADTPGGVITFNKDVIPILGSLVVNLTVDDLAGAKSTVLATAKEVTCADVLAKVNTEKIYVVFSLLAANVDATVPKPPMIAAGKTLLADAFGPGTIVSTPKILALMADIPGDYSKLIST